MALGNVFKASTRNESPLDASGGVTTKAPVSDFLTIQSFANFPTMVGALTAAWHGLQRLLPELAAIWVPYALAGLFGLVSYLSSLDGLRKNGRLEFGTCITGGFVALLNSIVLAGMCPLLLQAATCPATRTDGRAIGTASDPAHRLQ